MVREAMHSLGDVNYKITEKSTSFYNLLSYLHFKNCGVFIILSFQCSAVKEVRKIQKTRAKLKMDEGVVIGLATRIRAFTITADVEERQVSVILKNFDRILHIIYSTTHIPLDVFHYGESMNNELTVYCHNINKFPYTKIVFEMGSIEEVENFIAAVKLRPKPHINIYEHDGNV
jgi:hypothetical protein